MGVFPAASRSHVPQPWGELMIDPEAKIIDFYPEDFKIDLNGKKYAWQGVALLPFVDEVRLKAALAPYYDKLTSPEIERNIRGDDRLYVREGHKGYNLLRTIYTDNFEQDTEIQIDGKMFEGMSGRVLFSKNCIPADGSFESPVRGLSSVNNVRAISVRFRDPKYADDFLFPAKRLPGAEDPPKVLKPEDLARQGANFTPRFGFGERNNRANLGQAGHRMVNHYSDRRNQGAYAAIPPPMSFGGNNRGGMVAQNERGFNRGGFHQDRHRGFQNHGGHNRDHGQGGYRDRNQGFQNHGRGGGHHRGGFNNQGHGGGRGGGWQGNNQGYQNRDRGYQDHRNQGNDQQGNRHQNQGYGNRGRDYGNNGHQNRGSRGGGGGGGYFTAGYSGN